MKKKYYLLFAFLVFTIQGISAQNMHRDITFDTITPIDFVNKTIVMKYNPETYDNEYYILASYRDGESLYKNKLALFKLTSSFSVLDSYIYENTNYSNSDFVIEDMIVVPNGDFVFCGRVVKNGISYGIMGRISEETYELDLLKEFSYGNTEPENLSYNSISFSPDAYFCVGMHNNRQLITKISYNFNTAQSVKTDNTWSFFTDNTLFEGNTANTYRIITVGSSGSNVINIVAFDISLNDTINKQIKLPSQYTIEGDVVVGKIDNNNYALSVAIRDNYTQDGITGFFLMKFNYTSVAGDVLDISEYKIYLFEDEKCLISDICYDPFEMNICVTGKLIPTLYGRPFIAKINVNDFTDVSARYFASGFTNNDTQGYDLNKTLHNIDALSLVSAGNIRFSTPTQRAGVYVTESYMSSIWETDSCGDESLPITNKPINIQLIETFGYEEETIDIATLSMNKTYISSISNSKCIGFYGYNFRKPIEEVFLDEIKIHTNNNFIQIEGFIDGSEYKIYNLAGKIISKGVINSSGVVSIEKLHSGMYLISVTNKKVLQKTSKFIKL